MTLLELARTIVLSAALYGAHGRGAPHGAEGARAHEDGAQEEGVAQRAWALQEQVQPAGGFDADAPFPSAMKGGAKAEGGAASGAAAASRGAAAEEEERRRRKKHKHRKKKETKNEGDEEEGGEEEKKMNRNKKEKRKKKKQEKEVGGGEH